MENPPQQPSDGQTAAATEPNPFENRQTKGEQTTSAQDVVPPPAAKSLLSTITGKRRRRPILGMLYGPPGVGKSTFGSKMPDVVFLQVERGLDSINVKRFPIPKTFGMFYRQLETLRTEEHPFKSIVIDTADELEILIFKHVCTEGKVSSIEKYEKGYGKGYVRARELWVGVLDMLIEMSERFNIMLLAHAHLKSVFDPTLTNAYDIWKPKIQDKSLEIIRQRVDLILFAQAETVIDEPDDSRRKRGIVTGDRFLYTQPGSGFEAKNRYDLEPRLPLKWEALEAGLNKFYS